MLYYDTDSVIYRWKPGQPTIALGDYLRDMTDELKPGDYNTEFVSGGPKNYGYETHLGHVYCKVRGFTLNIQGKQQLNFQVMRENVLNEILDPLENGERCNIDVESPFFFNREPSSKRLKVGPRAKQYGLVYDKRVVDPSTFQTYPYGYKPYLVDVDMTNVETLKEL